MCHNSSASDTLLGIQVAIKKIYQPFARSDLCQRAYLELKQLKLLKHENVNPQPNSFFLRTSICTICIDPLTNLCAVFFPARSLACRMRSCHSEGICKHVLDPRLALQISTGNFELTRTYRYLISQHQGMTLDQCLASSTLQQYARVFFYQLLVCADPPDPLFPACQ